MPLGDALMIKIKKLTDLEKMDCLGSLCLCARVCVRVLLHCDMRAGCNTAGYQFFIQYTFTMSNSWPPNSFSIMFLVYQDIFLL